MRASFLFALPLLLALSACYEPTRFVDSRTASFDTAVVSSNGTIYPINTGHQICNPSISPDTADFPSSLLWLGFSGQLTVADPIPEGYTTSGVRQHDRLTISDQDNRVQWFVTQTDVPAVVCEFQDPEWSTHPKYINTMGGVPESGICEDGQIYHAIAIRTSDKSSLVLGQRTLIDLSTPHLWVDPTVLGSAGSSVSEPSYNENGWVDTGSIRQYFGTRNVKSAFSLRENGLTVHYIDWSSANPTPVRLAKPVGHDNSKAESALLSPDGKWVAYNVFDGAADYSAYVQQLQENSQPILLAEGASDPHWWVDAQGNWFVVYTVLPAGKTYAFNDDLRDASLAEGAGGATWVQQVQANAGAASALAFRKVGDPVLLANLPFRGGLSPDGKWLATGTNNAYLLELP